TRSAKSRLALARHVLKCLRRSFFFSSRRRHTRCYRDWSSDVCSSDLRIEHAQHLSPALIKRFADDRVVASMQPYHAIDDGRWAEIGRASCRERMESRGVEVGRQVEDEARRAQSMKLD